MPLFQGKTDAANSLKKPSGNVEVSQMGQLGPFKALTATEKPPLLPPITPLPPFLLLPLLLPPLPTLTPRGIVRKEKRKVRHKRKIAEDGGSSYEYYYVYNPDEDAESSSFDQERFVHIACVFCAITMHACNSI